MDSLDYKILKLLKENARIKASDISKEIHLSVSTVLERIHKLEKTGIIESYTIITNDQVLGNDLVALMEVSLSSPQYNDSFVAEVKENPNVISCYYVTGNFDYILKVACSSSAHLEELHKWLNSRKGVRQICTHFILNTIKNEHSSFPDENSIN